MGSKQQIKLLSIISLFKKKAFGNHGDMRTQIQNTNAQMPMLTAPKFGIMDFDNFMNGK